MQIEQERLGFFNARLEQAINRRNVSPVEVAKLVGTSYEHMRKLIRGSCLPSDALVTRICTGLHLNQREMSTRVKKDRIIFRFGWAAVGVKPHIGAVYILSELLTREQWNVFRIYIRALAESKAKNCRMTGERSDLANLTL
jgi:hypothetical protein